MLVYFSQIVLAIQDLNVFVYDTLIMAIQRLINIRFTHNCATCYANVGT
jgi:hypothetical protein